MTFALKVILALILLTCLAGVAIVLLRRTLGRERTAKIAGALVALVVSGMASLVLAEFATRWLYRDVTTTGDNRSYFARRWKHDHPPRVNAGGFRERDFAPMPAPGVYRIAVVGDSFTYGQGILETQRFSNLLEQDLNAGGAQYEVLNFGVPGSETVDEIKILEESVVPAHPDFVLLQWFINDVENADHGDRPQFKRLIPSDTLSDLLFKHSALFFLVNFGWQQIQVKASDQPSYDQYMVNRFSDPNNQYSRSATEALNSFFDICKADGFPAGAVLFPELLENLDSDYPYNFLHDRTLATCSQRHLECVDLRSAYAPHKPAKGLWANRLDSHPGPEANRIAADRILAAFGDRWKAARMAKLAPATSTQPDEHAQSTTGQVETGRSGGLLAAQE